MASNWKICVAIALASGLMISAIGCTRHGGDPGAANAAEFQASSGEAVPPTQIGMNLGNPSSWSSQWAFDDIVQASGLIRFGWADLTNQVPIDPTGHPHDVPAGTVLTVTLQMGSPRLPAGPFRCHISQGWNIRPFGDWTMDGSGTDFRMKVTKPISRNGIVLTLTAKAAHADLKELSCRSETKSASRLFNPAFLEDSKPYRVIRFMDWMRTNEMSHRDWATRPTPAFFSQAGKEGVALEHMVALVNELGSDPWFTMPFDADPTYYRAFATYVRDHLAGDRKVYVEFSNEVWNTSFAQGKEAARLGQLRYPGIPAYQASDYYYADRVREVMAIWSDVFRGQGKRLVRVLASQAVNPRRAEEALQHENTWRSVDALATAPYFGTSGADITPVGGSRVDAIFQQAPRLVDDAIGHAHVAKLVAAKYHLRYISYEGGPDFTSFRPDLRADTLAVNQDQRMHDVYARFLRRWREEIGDLLVLFDSVSTPSGGASYGHRQYTGQPLAEAPKARAVVEAIQR